MASQSYPNDCCFLEFEYAFRTSCHLPLTVNRLGGHVRLQCCNFPSCAGQPGTHVAVIGAGGCERRGGADSRTGTIAPLTSSTLSHQIGEYPATPGELW